MQLVHENNVNTAVDPQAITTPPWPKEPLSNNDPTRNVSTPAQARRTLLIALSTVLLVALLLATIAAIVR
jgi:hypothetical protein